MGQGAELNLGTFTTYPLHSRSCKICGVVIELRSESQPDDNFNCAE